MTQLVDIYLQLHQNDGNSEPEPLHVLLNCKPRFNSQIDYLYSVLQAGKGFRNIDTSRADPSYEGLTQDESKENSGNTSQKGEDGVGLTVTYSANEDRSGFQTPNDPRREEEEDYELDFRSPATIQRAAMGVGGQLSTVDQGTYATETLQMFEHADSTDYHEQIGHGHTLDNNTPRANVEGYESAGDELTQSITDLGNGQDDQGTNAGSPKRSGSFSSATLRGEASEDAKGRPTSLTTPTFQIANLFTGAASESRMNTNSHSFDQIPVGTSQDGPYGAVDHDEIGYDEYEFEFDEGKNNGENLTEHYPLPQEDYEEHLPRYSKHQTLPEEKTSSKSSGPPTASIFDEDNENEIDYQDDDDLEPSHVEETTLATQPEPRKSLSPDSLKRQRSLEDDPKPSESTFSPGVSKYVSRVTNFSTVDPKRIRSN